VAERRHAVTRALAGVETHQGARTGKESVYKEEEMGRKERGEPKYASAEAAGAVSAYVIGLWMLTKVGLVHITGAPFNIWVILIVTGTAFVTGIFLMDRYRIKRYRRKAASR
jgi:hypothetical protein